MNEYNSYDILAERAKQKVIDKLKRKNRPQQKPARTYSEVSSGDVHSPISSCATDTLRTSKNATSRIQRKTQSAKNNIKKFQNNDFLIDFSSFQTVVRGLRKMLSLEYKGGSNYADYITPNGIFSFRLSNHNANGNNFESGHINVSVYVAYHKYDVPESEIDFKEFPITPETFETNPQQVVSCIVNGVDKALKGEGFSLPPEISTSEHYPQITTENKTTKDMKKQTIKLNESQLRNIVKESIKNVLSELDYANSTDTPEWRIYAKKAYEIGKEFWKYNQYNPSWESYTEDEKETIRRQWREFLKHHSEEEMYDLNDRANRLLRGTYDKLQKFRIRPQLIINKDYQSCILPELGMSSTMDFGKFSCSKWYGEEEPNILGTGSAYPELYKDVKEYFSSLE